MRPVQHITSNDVLVASSGFGIEPCRALAITRHQYEDGAPAVMSFWQPSDAERAAIAAGKAVYIHVLGTTHPPIFVGVEGVGVEPS